MHSVATPPSVDERSPVDLHTLADWLVDFSHHQSRDPEALAGWLQWCRQLIRAFGVAYLQRPAGGRWHLAPHCCAPAGLSELQPLLRSACRLAGMAAQQRRAQVARSEADLQYVFLAVPVPGVAQRDDVLLVILCGEPSEPVLQRILLTVQLIVAILSLSLHASPPGIRQRLDALLADTVREAAQGRDARQGLDAMVQQLPQLCDSPWVAAGRAGRSGVKLLAVSGAPRFDPQSELARCLTAVMSEALVRSAQPEGPLEDRVAGTSATRQLQELTGLNGVRAYHGQGPPGVVLVCLSRGEHEPSAQVQQTRQAAAELLAMVHRTLRPGWGLPVERLLGARWLQSPRSRRAVLAAAALLALVLLVLPVPYRVAASCVLQPAKRRYVAVPYDGRLESVLARAGDVVEAGQVIARMAGQEIQWELAAVRAEFDRARKEREAGLVQKNVAAAQLAWLEMQRLELKAQILEGQLQNLEIQSPIDGMIISGEPEKIEGSRLRMGQTLVEIAPLDKMVAEVAIPDLDINQVRRGDPVRIRFPASPTRTYTGHLERIYPRAEQRGGRNVFVADVRLGNPSGRLRPGMEGKVKIAGRPHSIVWNLFHRAWFQLCLRFGW